MNRRNFFGKSVLSVLGLFIAPKVISEECSSPPKDKKIINKVTAKRIEYYENTSNIDHKKYKKGQDCGNCRFYRGEKDWEPCSMAANQLVSKCGWCKLYRAKS